MLKKSLVKIVLVVLLLLIGLSVAAFILNPNSSGVDFKQYPTYVKNIPNLIKKIELTQENIDKEDFPIQCEVKSEPYAGTLYFKNGKMRGTNFTPKSEDSDGGIDNTDFLFKDNIMWMWNENTREGMYYYTNEGINLSESEDFDFTNPAIEKECKFAYFDKKVFELPENIEFADFEDTYKVNIKDALEKSLREAIEKGTNNY